MNQSAASNRAPRNEPRLRSIRGLVFCLGLIYFTACSAGEHPLPGGAVRLSTVTGKHLREISGAVSSRRHPGVLWVHNDGSDHRLFALRTNGIVVAVFYLPFRVHDLEGIASGPGRQPGIPYLYLADIGDNDGKRRSIQVYCFPEPELPSSGVSKAATRLETVEAFNVRYPGAAHNAEALLVDPLTADILLVTKEKIRARVYIANRETLQRSAVTTLTLAREISCPGVSAGDISTDGRQIILRRENAAWLWTRTPGETASAALARAPQRVAVIGPPTEPNGESIAWSPEGHGYYTVSEGKKPSIFFFPRSHVP